MSSEAGARKTVPGADENRSEEDLRQLENDYRELHDQAQKLITERVALESDINKLKKRTARLDEEIRLLKSPPLIVGHIQDLIDEESAIVRSSNGTVFQVAVNKRLQSSELKPGTRVALNQDTLAAVSYTHLRAHET